MATSAHKAGRKPCRKLETVGRYALLTGALLLAACAARRVAPPSTQEAIRGIKRVQRDLGFRETGNFVSIKPDQRAFHRCYYAGQFELPDSYEGLRMKDGTAEGCPPAGPGWDVFFYPIEAVAGANTPVTAALATTTIERLAVVVSHEDFHEDPQIQRLPTRIGEAAATLVGFLSAARYASTQHGPDSDTYRNLSREASLYRTKARIVNRYHEKIAALYRSLRERKADLHGVAERKRMLFDALQGECGAIHPEPTSFHRCLAANNNAGLGFEITYTRYYPLLYELHLALGADLKKTIAALRQCGELGPYSEEKTIRGIRGIMMGEPVPPVVTPDTDSQPPVH